MKLVRCPLTFVASCSLLLVAICQAAPDEPATPAPATQTQSALESTGGAGWVDLLPKPDLDGWKRTEWPGKPLKEPNIWSIDTENKTLKCDGTGTHENLMLEKELGDGVYHVEWRFPKIEGGKGYNSGVFVRSSLDGKIWHQAQVGDRNVGYLFGMTLKDGRPEKFKVDDHVPQRGKEPGEWNTYELTCKGSTVLLWINGAVTASWNGCEVFDGHFGFEAEGFPIEFRNIKFKPVGQ